MEELYEKDEEMDDSGFGKIKCKVLFDLIFFRSKSVDIVLISSVLILAAFLPILSNTHFDPVGL